jgi:ABC-type multidrug transport system fused ATPase/permease subunit
MQDGAIAEIGNHDTLLAQKGLYAEMYFRQQQNDTPDSAPVENN